MEAMIEQVVVLITSKIHLLYLDNSIDSNKTQRTQKNNYCSLHNALDWWYRCFSFKQDRIINLWYGIDLKQGAWLHQEDSSVRGNKVLM